MAGKPRELTEELEERFDAATSAVEDAWLDLESRLGSELAEHEGSPFFHLLIAWTPGITTHLPEEGRVYYEVSDETAENMAMASHHIPDVADMVRSICASNVFEGVPIPAPFRPLMHLIINGNDPLAKRRGAKDRNDFLVRWFLRQLALGVELQYGIKLTRGDDDTSGIEMSACDAVALVANRHGVKVSARKIIDYCNHRDHRKFRQRADALANFFKDEALHNWGALKTLPSSKVLFKMPTKT